MSESTARGTGMSTLKKALLAIEQLQARLDAAERGRHEPVAIVGFGCRFPGGADSPAALWQKLCEGFDAISEVPERRWRSADYYDPNPDAPGKVTTRFAGFVDRIGEFDPQFFGISPREAAGMDPQQRLLLQVSWEALEHAGIAPDRLSGSRTGVFVGICGADFMTMQLKWNDPTRIGPYFASGIAHSIASGRLSYVLGLQGPSVSIDTACSSSLVAVHLAYQSLQLGDCRMAIAGGTHAILAPDVSVALAKARMLAPDGRCKAFDAAADGFVEGEGCGIVILKRLSDALADGDRVLAVIRGSACNQDGASSGLTVPNGPSQQAVIREALSRAGVAPADVGYVETHGTGTSLGDPIEVQAIGAALRDGRAENRPVAIGSIKTNIGHLQSAAGIAGLIKAVLILQHGTIPPHLHLQVPNPLIPWSDLPVVVPTELSPGFDGYERRIAGVTSLGFSGTNAHVILEQAPAVTGAPASLDRPLHVLTLSARKSEALGELARGYRLHLESTDDAVADVCFTANTGRAHLTHRLALVAQSRADMMGKLDAAIAHSSAPGVLVGDPLGMDAPRVAFLFTGQGSQYAGMGRELYDTQPVFRGAIDLCAELLKTELTTPLLDVLYPPAGASSPLDETAFTQPALFAIEYALAELWRSWGVRPAVVLGHSIGELVAACVAGMMSVEDAIRLVAVRGRLMQALPRGGAMAALVCDEARASAAIAPFAGRISIAAINGRDEVVISGASEAVDAVSDSLQKDGIDARRLNVSHAFHSPLMQPMLDAFEQTASALSYRPAQLAVMSNLTGASLTKDELGRGYWRRHVSETVQFSRGMEAVYASGCRLFVEIGPKPTLSALGRRLLPDDCVWLSSVRPGQSNWSTLLESAATLHVKGVTLDWEGFDKGYARRKVALPTYPFTREQFWMSGPPRSATLTEPPSAGGTVQPFDGRRIKSALREKQFEYKVGLRTAPYLADHRKYGRLVFPVTAMIEMIRSAAADITGSTSHVIENFVIGEPLFLDDDRASHVQAIFTRQKDAASFQIFSAEDADQDSWLLHASGTIRSLAGSELEQERSSDGNNDVEAVRARCGGEMSPAVFYELMQRDGHEYGPAFHSVTDVRSGDGEAIAEIHVPDAAGVAQPSYRVHPVLLDGCLQVARAALSPDAERALGGDAFLPVGFDRIALAADFPSRVFARAEVREQNAGDADTLIADIRMLDAGGRVIGDVQGMTMRRFRRDAGLPLSHITWQPLEPLTSTTPGARRRWMIFADAAGFGDRLAKELNRQGDAVAVVSSASELDRLLASAASTEPIGVVCCSALDAADPAAGDMLDAAASGLDSILDAVKALGRHSLPAAHLWLVTRGAQPVSGSDTLCLAQSPVWGLARTIAIEYPELHAVCVDLDPAGEPAEAGLLAADLLGDSQEDQIAYRKGARYAPRLVPLASSLSDAAHAGGESRELHIGERGRLDSLALRPSPRQPPASGEVEIEVVASGLNFRDVLNALGVYEGPAGPLGSECAGRISAIGAGVSGFEIGHEVIALTTDTFRTHVLAQAARTVSKPARLTFEVAASVGVAFTTAKYALERIARLSAGQRVLIHAAAGGVGLAAVQLAKAAGAEIFATAGSPEKHAYLRSLGIAHVMSSRNGEFADAIAAATGGRGVDVVLNSLNGDLIAKSLSATAHGGCFLEIGKAGIWTEAEVAAVRPDVRYFPLYLGGSDDEDVRSLLEDALASLDDGRVRMLPVTTYPIEQAPDAFRFMAQARHIGKIVLMFGDRRPEDTPTLRRDATYLITGGLGAIGIEVARWMAAGGAGHLALVGRRAPSAAAAEAIRALTDAGTRITTIEADISSTDDAQALFDRLDRDPLPVRGIIHAAGVIDDGVIAEQTLSRVSAVMRPKVRGAWNLHAHSKKRPLDFCVFFSSLSALVPAAGQSGYAAANAFLDALAYRRRAEGHRAVSITWGPWLTGLAAGVANAPAWDDLGIVRLTPERALAALGSLLAPAQAQVVVAPIDWSRFARTYIPGHVPSLLRSCVRPVPAPLDSGESPEPPRDLRHEIEQLPSTRRRAAVDAHILAQAQKVLGLGSKVAIDVRQPLRDLGLDSLMALELRNEIGRLVGKALSATLLFKYPTLQELGDYVYGDVLALAEEAPDTASPDDSFMAMVESLDDLEVKRLLAQELEEVDRENSPREDGTHKSPSK